MLCSYANTSGSNTKKDNKISGKKWAKLFQLEKFPMTHLLFFK